MTDNKLTYGEIQILSDMVARELEDCTSPVHITATDGSKLRGTYDGALGDLVSIKHKLEDMQAGDA